MRIQLDYKDSYRLIDNINYQVKNSVKKSQFFQRIGIFVQVLSERKQKQQCLFSLLRFFDERFDVVNNCFCKTIQLMDQKITTSTILKVNVFKIVCLHHFIKYEICYFVKIRNGRLNKNVN